jgi:alanine racemase
MLNHHFFLSEIAALLRAQRVSNRTDDAGIALLLTDSRHVSVTEGCLFFALTGARNDGHKYIEELYRKGIRHFVVHALPAPLSCFPGTDFLVVPDTLDALQQLAAAYRSRFAVPVVGITGSNGKTIVKEWLAFLLSADRKVVKSPKSYNSQIGVPLSVWEMQTGDEMAIFEAGISQAGEMERLEKIIRPTIGLVTNVGAAHDAGFGSRTQKIAEKLKLLAHARRILYSCDHTDVARAVADDEVLKKIPAFTWGRSAAASLQLTAATAIAAGGTLIEARYGGEIRSLVIPFTDQAAIENAMHCWAFLLSEGYPHDTIARRMCNLPVIEMRMELKEGIHHCTIINDSYSSDYNSLQMAVDFLHQQSNARTTVVLSDILQSGEDEETLYAAIARLLKAKAIDRLVGVGTVISRQAGKFEMEKYFFPDTDAFLQNFPFDRFHDETILLKGARRFAFEKIDRALQQKTHETVLAINLNALAHNLNYYRSTLPPGVRLMVMVKAFSYGSGSYEIAALLQFHQVHYLAVAYVDEGVELRKAGITMPIMVMSPEVQSLDQLLEYRLEPEIYSFRLLRLWQEKIEAPNAPQTPPAVHLKLDTGMHRLGFEEKDMPKLLQELNATGHGERPALRIASVFSHLAGSDNRALDLFTQQQIAAFRRMSDPIVAAFDYPIDRHILNSAGLSRFPEAHFDMVRLGIGLYGVGVDEEEQACLQNVSTLKTVIAQIKQIPAGESVGYNRNSIASHDRRVGTLSIGYADGLNRRFGNGNGTVWVNGRPAPVIGNVCMDMCMVDLTGIDAHENDEVVIFGDHPSLRDVAKTLDTIPYEVLTGISRRVKRVYYQS